MWTIAKPGLDAVEPEKPKPLRAGAYDDPTPVRHGYTVTDLSRLAGVCIRVGARRGIANLDEMRSVATCALIEELHRHDHDPGATVLLRAAEDAITREKDRNWSNWGYNSRTHEQQKGFPVYWYEGAGTPLDEKVTERVAVHQVVATLTDRQREVLHHMADLGDRRAVALLLGVDPTTVSAVLGNARRAVAALWHEGETPRPVDFRAGRLNPYSPEAAAARPEIARRAVRIREQRRAEAREQAAA